MIARIFAFLSVIGVLSKLAVLGDDVVVTKVGKQFNIYSTQDQLDSGNKVNALLMGVGTGMSKDDYSSIATVLVQNLNNFIVAIVDPNPGNIDKTSGTKFGSVFSAVDSWLSTKNIPIDSWYVGGHSASGMACAEALNKTFLQPSSGSIQGFVGFDPYQYKTKPNVYNLPVTSNIWTMSHGGIFSSLQYCIPNLDESGKGFYEHASSANKTCSNHGLFTFSDTTSHCVFTDSSCLGLCGSSGSVTRTVTYANIATSIMKFVQGKITQFAANPFSNVAFVTRQACSN